MQLTIELDSNKICDVEYLLALHLIFDGMTKLYFYVKPNNKDFLIAAINDFIIETYDDSEEEVYKALIKHIEQLSKDNNDLE